MIRTINEYKNLEEIANTVVFREDGRELRLKDIGQVVYGERDREMLTRTDGAESVQIDIYKEADSNMVKVAERIKAAVGSINGSRRTTIAGKLFKEEDVVLQVVADRSIFIDNSIKEVKSTAVMGGFLAIGVLLIFLRDIRTTAIIAISIPISILVTFAPLDLLGVSLNIMSLGGLAMGIGMLVDSSIVVLESIFRCRAEGDSIRDAAIRGTHEVRGAVVASTLTSVCVFFPMVFVSGLAGQVFSDLGLTVVTSLIASLVVAVWFIPMLASRTGFKMKSGAGMVSHPLGSFAGRIRPATLLLRVLLPMALLLAVMIGAVLGYAYWMATPGQTPAKPQEIDYAGFALTILRIGGMACVIPLIVALLKVRLQPDDPRGETLAELWSSFSAFKESLEGHSAVLRNRSAGRPIDGFVATVPACEEGAHRIGNRNRRLSESPPLGARQSAFDGDARARVFYPDLHGREPASIRATPGGASERIHVRSGPAGGHALGRNGVGHERRGTDDSQAEGRTPHRDVAGNVRLRYQQHETLG
jgi:preprotein translocase subunit SecF